MNKKNIEEKIKIAKRGLNKSTPDGYNRLPLGQTLTEKFPVLDLGILPDVTFENWSLHIYGEVENECSFNFEDLKQLPFVVDVSDFHCVTHWSKFDVNWGGVHLSDLFNSVGIIDLNHYVTFHSYDGYTTNLPVKCLLDHDVLLAFQLDGKSLAKEHGGPARIIVPKRYAWKSAKWIKAIEIHKDDRPGFWEVRGYHNDADPWLEQRYANED